ncbi:MAG TPA: ABC transporter ATP-binding protein, partial [Gemmataceae bacterium]|nr:ABC transporter ATP-binding protein [Gemmataceae bacterium]
MSDTSVVVRAAGLGKKFCRSLRQSMLLGMKDSMRHLVGLRVDSSKLRPGEFWALRDVSFELGPGRCLGIMGVNGSGKTTLLRVLNGVYAPDSGSVMLRGRVGALIAAGAGFTPLLSGRENIYISGSVLGMSRREIDARLEEIVAFADIGDVIDSPVKYYSNGMSVRLGFAIAAMSEPEILIVDEVLAVGDLNFQKKCYEYLHRLKNQGTTILLVSHSVGAIWAICDEGLLLHEGRVEARGSVEGIIRAYDDWNSAQALTSASNATAGKERSELATEYGGHRGGTGDVVMLQTRCLGLDERERTEFEFGCGMIFESLIDVRARLRGPVFRYTLDSVHYKYIATLDNIEQGTSFALLEPGRYRLLTKLQHQNLR